LLIIGYSVVTFIRDYHEQNWGNAAFAGVNAVAASYAVVAFMGARNTLVDIWVGIIERLYVTDNPAPKAITRRRRSSAPRVAAPVGWQEVLYRGVPATATGEYFDGEGAFKILATPPLAPPQHNRRAADRAAAGGADRRDRRATDGPSGQRADDQVGTDADRRESRKTASASGR
jgi:hypothetical protein